MVLLCKHKGAIEPAWQWHAPPLDHAPSQRPLPPKGVSATSCWPLKPPPSYPSMAESSAVRDPQCGGIGLGGVLGSWYGYGLERLSIHLWGHVEFGQQSCRSV